MEVFGEEYSAFYDAMYAQKDYVGECDVIERLMLESLESSKAILDLGCGTGEHAIELATRGYMITGVDRSEAMITRARQKAQQRGVDVSFEVDDIQTFSKAEEFDVALMMFAVLGYQTSNEDALSALKNTRANLRLSGLLVFDVWFGPAVILVGPEERVRDVQVEGVQWRRTSSASLDVLKQMATVSLKMESLTEGSGEVIEETHSMRFFFPQEIDLLLESSGFERTLLAPFPQVDRKTDARTWNVVIVARAT